jgi:hypothetical protein
MPLVARTPWKYYLKSLYPHIKKPEAFKPPVSALKTIA